MTLVYQQLLDIYYIRAFNMVTSLVKIIKFLIVIKLMKNHFRDERIIVPLYKTLDFILERQ